MTAEGAQSVEVAGCEIPMRVRGSGPPLLYLHAEVEAGRPNPAMDALASAYQVFEPVHPGFGPTPLPEWLTTVDDVVLHYAELLAAAGLDRVDVVGSSLGGWIGLSLAAWYPERVRTLVLAGALGTRVPGVAIPDVFRLGPEGMLRAAFHDAGKIGAAFLSNGSVDGTVKEYHDMTAFARLTWSPYMYDPRLPGRLWRVRMPVLALWGAEDAITPPAHAAGLASCLSSATAEFIDECGHYPLLEQPEASAAAIGAFLAAASVPA